MTHEPDDPHALFLALMRADFAIFLRKAFSWLSGGAMMQWNWHLDAITHALDEVLAGRSTRLLVNAPPRSGKSEAISAAWVAWVLGRNPRHRFVCVSYSNDLSYPLGRMCLSIMLSPWYREVFPGTILKRTAAHDFQTTLNGGRLATSITGTLTGRGGDTIILDDVIKPQEADSEVVRANVNAWFQSTASSRLNDKRTGTIICVMQRLHQYDLAGLMIETGRYDVLSLPAIAAMDQVILLPGGRRHLFKAGNVLHPQREPMEVLNDQRAMMGSERFASQYLQTPAPAEGNIIKARWFKTYTPDALTHGGIIVQSIDTANKSGPTNDFSVIITALVQGKYVYILDVCRDRLEFFKLKQRVLELADIHRPHVIMIEDAGSGIGLLSEMHATAVPGNPAILARKVDMDKVSRVNGISAMIEAGQVLLPPDAPWRSEFKAELLAFPSGRFDDQVDALSQLLIWVRERHWYEVPPNAGPEIIEEGDYDDFDIDPDDDPWGAS